ncbi:hypothetical protein ERC79_01205 [Rhodococcus sp. ABRD24]|uniref:hypothetical protein n=1 Tax=Rhodococcus sp. ABRD24 TaxID=2507582 RepID=UPI00103E4B41|nr:hypothetical protein [Rhodococcus sp. ABRD24]QBJ94735.1 hypothetical protein ERC79_01205 [Rhodococcus sp. ABRD24]
MPSNPARNGRHRLGMENGVHVVLIPEVALALAEHRRNWFTGLLSPARHSFAAIRKRSAAQPVRWSPAAAG